MNPFTCKHIEATTLPDAWFQTVYACVEYGRRFKIDRGSFEGQDRLEFDYITVHIKYPAIYPRLPQVPAHYSIPNPVADDYLDDYMPYLVTAEVKEGESYTYGQRICGYPIDSKTWGISSRDDILCFINNYNKDILIQDLDVWKNEGIIYCNKGEWKLNQIELLIWTYKNKGFRNNQMVLQIAHPTDMLLLDPPCLRSIDTRIQDGKLHFVINFRSWDLWCISDDSEILTNNGWKTIDTISNNDKIASMKDNEIVYTKSFGINKSKYKGEMHRIKTKRIDQLITPTHNVFHKYVSHMGSKRVVSDKYEYTEAKDLKAKDGSFIPIAIPYNKGTFSIGILKAKLIGWILTDAYYKPKCNTIEIYQTVKKYANEIREILKSLEIQFTESIDSRTSNPLITFRLSAKDKLTKWIRKTLPNRFPIEKLLNLIKDDRQALFDSMIQADGSIKKGRNKTISKVFYSKCAKKREWFQRLALSLGYSTIINEKKGTVQISNKKESMIQRNHFNKGKLPVEDYDGRVWCVATKHSNFVMKRNNLISVTGNSGFPANLAGIIQMQEYIASMIGVEVGEMICTSKGLHLYDYVVELAEILRGKTCEEFQKGK